MYYFPNIVFIFLIDKFQTRITFGSDKSKIYDFLAKKEEGKLRREPIPDDLVVDKSNSEIIHTLVKKTRDVYNGPQYLLDHKDEPGLKLTDDSWISTDGKVTFFTKALNLFTTIFIYL